MRLYSLKPDRKPQNEASETYPGYQLSEVIDQFYTEGVVPDFLPADLGEDLVDEFDNEGYPIVDPAGNIRTDPMQRREDALMAGVTDPDPAPVSAPSTPPAPSTLPVE